MHLLFVVPYAPSLIRTRPYNLLRVLRRSGHTITLLTLVQEDSESAGLAALQDEGIRVIAERLARVRSLANSLAALPTPDPLQAHYAWNPNLARRLDEVLLHGSPPVDIVHVEHLRGVRYALHARETASSLGIPVIWDSVDCISHLFRQAAAHSTRRGNKWLTGFELGRTERFEGRLVWQFDGVLTTSPVDRMELLSLSARYRPGPAPMHVVPNGVDLDYFKPDPATRGEPATLVVSGKMSYHANVAMVRHLVQKVMPLVWSHRPEVKVTIAGKDPAPEVLSLASDARITVTGFVADLRPYLRTATLAVAPITYGAGIQNKVLEAMACGTPVVASRQASAALEAGDGRELLVADDPAALSKAILALLADPARRDALGRAGRAYVERHHDWNGISGRLETIYDSSLARSFNHGDKNRRWVPAR